MSSEREVATQEFFEAVSDSNVKEVDRLLSSGAICVDLKNADFYERTALHAAAASGDLELARLLVDTHRAPLDLTDLRGQTPLQVATDYRNIHIVKFLLQRGANQREYAAPYLNDEEVDEFFRAVAANDVDEVRRLIAEHELDVNVEDRSTWHRTALEVAAAGGHLDLVRVLVDQFHADVNHEDDLEENAYIIAVNNNHDNVANFLREKGSKGVLIESSGESDTSLNFPVN